MKPRRNKIFRIALIAIFYISCTKEQANTSGTGGPPNYSPQYAHALDSVFYCQPSTTTSYAMFVYTFHIPQLDTVQSPVIKLYVYKFSGTSEFNNYARQGGHFTFTLLNLSNDLSLKTRIIAKWWGSALSHPVLPAISPPWFYWSYPYTLHLPGNAPDALIE